MYIYVLNENYCTFVIAIIVRKLNMTYTRDDAICDCIRFFNNMANKLFSLSLCFD